MFKLILAFFLLHIHHSSNYRRRPLEILKVEIVSNFLSDVMSALFFVVLVILYFGYRKKQKNSMTIMKQNDQLSTLIQEKQWLIQEIHHRVKNNLQIVIGLLQGESSFISNKEALNAIRSSEQRLNAIALVHSKLYGTEHMATVNMQSYVEELINYLKTCFEISHSVQFEKEIDDIQLSAEQAVSVGLILNEAITSSIKYAFEGVEFKRIRIFMNYESDGQILLFIDDNGKGCNEDMNAENPRSFGLTLIRGLGKQLNGNLIIISENGISISLVFKEHHER